MKDAITLMAATASEGTSDSFWVTGSKKVTVFVYPDLGAGETAILQHTINDTDTTNVKSDALGNPTQLDENQNMLVLEGPGQFCIAKSATSAATGVYLRT